MAPNPDRNPPPIQSVHPKLTGRPISLTRAEPNKVGSEEKMHKMLGAVVCPCAEKGGCFGVDGPARRPSQASFLASESDIAALPSSAE
jgi:hypothetical protein